MTKDELVEKVANVIAQIEMDREGYPLSRSQEEIYNDADEMARAALAIAMPAAFEMAAEAQPSTAENPNESAYQRGRFDGVMEYAKALRAEGEKWK